jgi:hypothetical protein
LYLCCSGIGGVLSGCAIVAYDNSPAGSHTPPDGHVDAHRLADT